MKLSYKVLDTGVNKPEIAGKRRKVGEVIKLTKAEAQYEVLRETVALEPEETKAAEPAPKSKGR